jgi:hypothetical protein
MILGFNSEFNNELGLDFAMVVIPDDILEFWIVDKIVDNGNDDTVMDVLELGFLK